VGASQDLVVKWVVGDHPVVEEPVNATTDHGTFSAPTVITDDFGNATFTISAATAGTATIEVTGGTESAVLVLQFVDTLSAVGSESPYGDRAVLRMDGQGLEYWLFEDEVGFLATERFDPANIPTLLASRAITNARMLGEQVYALTLAPFDPPAGRSKLFVLREVARQLTQRTEGDISDAGLVVRLRDRDQWSVMTDELLITFDDGIGDADFPDILNENNLVQTGDFSHISRLIQATFPATLDTDALTRSSSLMTSSSIASAEPNFILVLDNRYIPVPPQEDLGFDIQWHLENAGDFGIEDADVDAERAWRYTWGSSDTLIAIVDSGFDVDHYDLEENVWTGAGGARGVDLVDGDATDLLNYTNDPESYSHGTRAAGVAAARGGNTIGYTGTCPHCRLFLIRAKYQLGSRIQGVNLAIANNAKIVSNSWGRFTNSTAFDTAIDAARAAKVTVLMAMSNDYEDNCLVALPDTSARPDVIAVSGITDEDLKSSYPGEALGYGTCMDVLAPSRGGVNGIRTTSVDLIPGTTNHIPTYWDNFSGTSAATPLVAGIVGLMKTLDPNLEPDEIQKILQDTADRVDDAHGNYSLESGFSDPAGTPTHGYGRVNAFEAVRLVAPQVVASGDFMPGRGKQDLLLRDTGLDWGNTEQPSNTIFNSPRGEDKTFRSVDVVLDNFPFQTVPLTPDGFLSLVAETPEVGVRSRIYVRVRNRGPKTVPLADLKVHYATFADTFPDLPADFWTSFPADSSNTSVWHPLPKTELQDVAYSGPSIAGCPVRSVPQCLPAVLPLVADAAQVAVFDVPALDWNDGNEALAFIVAVHSAADPLQAKLNPPPAANFRDVITAVTLDNNVTLLQFAQTGPPQLCDQETITIIYVLILIVIILFVRIIWLWRSGRPVPVWIYIALVITIVIIIVIVVKNPWCIEQLFSGIGMAEASTLITCENGPMKNLAELARSFLV
jgi:subtilisin family serine protease